MAPWSELYVLPVTKMTSTRFKRKQVLIQTTNQHTSSTASNSAHRGGLCKVCAPAHIRYCFESKTKETAWAERRCVWSECSEGSGDHCDTHPPTHQHRQLYITDCSPKDVYICLRTRSDHPLWHCMEPLVIGSQSAFYSKRVPAQMVDIVWSDQTSPSHVQSKPPQTNRYVFEVSVRTKHIYSDGIPSLVVLRRLLEGLPVKYKQHTNSKSPDNSPKPCSPITASSCSSPAAHRRRGSSHHHVYQSLIPSNDAESPSSTITASSSPAAPELHQDSGHTDGPNTPIATTASRCSAESGEDPLTV
eukprot:Filipodium_phascolosomae@DN1564_c0_g1_i2.p1